MARGFPGWFTRVEYYKAWIQCIIDKSIQFKNEYAKVDEACAKLERVGRKQPDCEEVVANPDIALFDMRTIGNTTAEEICIPYNTGAFALADNESVDDEIFGGIAPADADDEIFGV